MMAIWLAAILPTNENSAALQKLFYKSDFMPQSRKATKVQHDF